MVSLFSEVLDSAYKVRLRALEWHCVSSKCPSRVWDNGSIPFKLRCHCFCPVKSRQIYKKQTEWKYVYDPTFLTSVGTENSGDPITSKKADSESVDKIEEIEKIKLGSVQQLVQKIELQAGDKPCDELKSEVVIASNPEPSDDELSKGCFTQVSCAGKVVVNSGSTTTAGTPQPSSLEKIGTVPTPQPSQKEFRPVPSPRSGH